MSWLGSINDESEVDTEALISAPVIDKKIDEPTFLDVMSASYNRRKFSRGEGAKDNVLRNRIRDENMRYNKVTGSDFNKDFIEYLKATDDDFKTGKIDPVDAGRFADFFEWDPTGVVKPKSKEEFLVKREEFIKRQRLLYPGLDDEIPRARPLEEFAKAESLRYGKEYVETAEDAPDSWSTFIADSLGFMGAFVQEPTAAKGMLLGGATGGGSLAKTVLFESILGAGVEVATLKDRADYAAEIGDPMTTQEVFGDVISGAVAPVLIIPTVKAVGKVGSKILGLDYAARINDIAAGLKQMGDDDAARVALLAADEPSIKSYDITRYADNITSEQAATVFNAVEEALQNGSRFVDTTKIDLPDNVLKNVDLSKIDNPLIRAQLELIKRVSESFDSPTQLAKVEIRPEEQKLLESFFAKNDVNELSPGFDPRNESVDQFVARRENYLSSVEADSIRANEFKNTQKKGVSSKYMRQFSEESGLPVGESIEKTLGRTREKLEKLFGCRYKA